MSAGPPAGPEQGPAHGPPPRGPAGGLPAGLPDTPPASPSGRSPNGPPKRPRQPLAGLRLLGQRLARLVGGAGFRAAAFFATLQVYFRDTSSFLPFFVRIWMYLSPILWAPEHIAGRFPQVLMTIIQLNPMYSMLGGYSELIQGEGYPPLYMWLTAAAWAAVICRWCAS